MHVYAKVRLNCNMSCSDRQIVCIVKFQKTRYSSKEHPLVNLYILEGVWFFHKILRIGQKAFVGPIGPRCQPKAGPLACADSRPA